MQPEDHVRMLHMVETAEAALSFIAGHQRTDLACAVQHSMSISR